MDLNLWFGYRITDHESENSMTIQNLAIVFGPTLFKQAQPGVNGNMNGMADASLQNKARLPLGDDVFPRLIFISLRLSRRS